jgi:cobalt/nickel transport system ATP-binding protein
MNKILFLENVAAGYSTQTPILRDITLSLAPGERVALLGLNGCGKTTLLYTIAGLLPHTGRIEVSGLELNKHNAKAARERIGFLFSIPEDQLFFPRVMDDTAFTLQRRGTAPAQAHARAQGMLEKLGVGFAGDLSPFHLSHGQRQRVALAGVLVGAPALLLLDEPTAALDPPGKRSLATLLASLDAAQLIATHDLDFARRTCARFVIMDKGRVVYDGAEVEWAERFWGGMAS